MSKPNRAAILQLDEEIHDDLQTAEFGRFVTEATPLQLFERLSELLASHARDRRCSTFPDGAPDTSLLHARAIVLHLRNRTAAGKVIDVDKLPGRKDVVQ